MQSKKRRINIGLERSFHKAIAELAHHDQVSLSLIAQDLIREALEIHEDRVLTETAGSREKTFVRAKALNHQVWHHKRIA